MTLQPVQDAHLHPCAAAEQSHLVVPSSELYGALDATSNIVGIAELASLILEVERDRGIYYVIYALDTIARIAAEANRAIDAADPHSKARTSAT